MRNLIIVLIVLFGSCKRSEYKISELKSEVLTFSDLPLTMKEFLSQPPSNNNDNNSSSLVLINSKDSSRYDLEVIKTWYGPWVDCLKIHDATTNIRYKINQGVPSPFFIYENRLYIPDRFNTLFVNKNIEQVKFTSYLLKQ